MEGFNWVMGFVLPYLNFAIFAFLAFKFFKKPMSEFALGRREKYEKLFNEAKLAKIAVEKQGKDLEIRLGELDAELEKHVESSKSSAEFESQRILKNAREIADHITAEAKRVAQAEVENARNEIRQEIISHAKKMAEEQIRTSLDANKQLSIFKNRTSNLEAINLGDIR